MRWIRSWILTHTHTEFLLLKREGKDSHPASDKQLHARNSTLSFGFTSGARAYEGRISGIEISLKLFTLIASESIHNTRDLVRGTTEGFGVGVGGPG